MAGIVISSDLGGRVALWGYPIMLGLHVVGLAIVVGIFVMRDLAPRRIVLKASVSSRSTVLRALGWTGFLINAISGCFLFASQATYFITNTPFLLKISMIFLAAICSAVLQNLSKAGAVEWDGAGAASGTVRSLALLSTALWMSAIIFGRLVAYF